MKRLNWHKFGKFAVGGLLVFLFEYIFTIVLTQLYPKFQSLIYAIALFIGLFLLYFYHKHVTFGEHRCSIVSKYKFILVYSFAYTIDWVIVFFLTYKIHYTIAIPITNLSVGFGKYLIHKHWTFIKREKML